jgi:chromosome segregation ATPase
MPSAENWYYYAGAIAAIVGVLIAAYKLRPESTRIFVETAKVTLDMANDARDDMAAQLTKLEERINILDTKLEEAEARAQRADRRAAEADRRTSKLREELEDERADVKALRSVVTALQEELKKNGIEIPPHLVEITDTVDGGTK